MTTRGQMIVAVAIMILIAVVLLAVMVDSGRIFSERVRLDRSAQSAADAGIAWVAEQMVTQAVPRQTAAADRDPCYPDSEFGQTSGACTETPHPDEISHWLSDEDRSTLVAPPARATARAISLEYAQLNGFDPSAPEDTAEVIYPYMYDPEGSVLRLLVRIAHQLPGLWRGPRDTGLLELSGDGLSEIPFQ